MNLNSIREKDVSFGLNSEKNILDTFRKIFGNDLNRTENKYALFDFENEETLVELKTRRCSSKAFQDTMIGHNKYSFAMESPKKTYFCFKFTDGLFIHEFKKNKEYTIRDFERYREGEFTRPHVFINNCEMIKV
jgi:hypothetical protein